MFRTIHSLSAVENCFHAMSNSEAHLKTRVSYDN